MISPVLRGSLDLAHGLEEPAVAHDGVGQEDLGGRGRTLRRVRYKEPTEGGLPWQRDRAKMRFIAGGR